MSTMLIATEVAIREASLVILAGLALALGGVLVRGLWGLTR